MLGSFQWEGGKKFLFFFFFLEAVALPAQGACSVIMQSKGPSATCNNREITWLSRGTRELSPALETGAPQQGLIRFWFFLYWQRISGA